MSQQPEARSHGGELSTYGELADLLEALPLIVREARRARRATLVDVTEQTGIAQSTLSRLERPTLRTRRNGDTSAISLGNAIILLRWLDLGADPSEGESDSS
jgi:hypothetical protein